MDQQSKQKLITALQTAYPNGHPGFIPMMVEMMALHSQKNYEYAHGGDPLGNFKRVATIMSLYPWINLGQPATIALVYAMKQIDAVLWQFSKGYDGHIESMTRRLDDVLVYAGITKLILEEGPYKPKETPEG